MREVKHLHKNYLQNNYTELEHLLYKIFFHGAPTFFSEKPSSLVCFNNSKSIKLKDIWDKHKKYIQEHLEMECYELTCKEDCVSVLFYNKLALDKILSDRKIKIYLEKKGYKLGIKTEEALLQLQKNYRLGCPDEIGVFLGYPLSDVIAFSSKNKGCSLCIGYWRVYSKVEEAMMTFRKYDEARMWVYEFLSGGRSPIEILKAM